MVNILKKHNKHFAGLGPKSRPFLNDQPTTMNQKPNVTSLLFFTLLKVCIEAITPKRFPKKFLTKDFFSKCDEIRRKLRIWSHLLKKSLVENFIFCAVMYGKVVKRRDVFRNLSIIYDVYFLRKYLTKLLTISAKSTILDL